ncbi:MAG TPA: hypothetical protein VFE05_24520 [Longimicrobiaceae bacterium]|jgi:hypothetical protein|nr:hypothetical protein [Longimicrobiaceae bacterium]
MDAPTLSQTEIKDAFKTALIELLEERGDFVREVLSEVIEDLSLLRAIEEGAGTGMASRDDVFRALEGRG